MAIATLLVITTVVAALGYSDPLHGQPETRSPLVKVRSGQFGSPEECGGPEPDGTAAYWSSTSRTLSATVSGM